MPTTGAPVTRLPCPPAATIEKNLSALEAAWKTSNDSDYHAKLLDTWFAQVPTGCTTPAQDARVLILSHGAMVTAHADEAGFAGWTELVKRMGVGALGVVLLLLGFMLIGGEASINTAAARLGKAIGGAVKR